MGKAFEAAAAAAATDSDWNVFSRKVAEVWEWFLEGLGALPGRGLCKPISGQRISAENAARDDYDGAIKKKRMILRKTIILMKKKTKQKFQSF